MSGLQMNFPVKKLIETLQFNRDKHSQAVDAAMDKYRKAFIDELQQKISNLKAGKSAEPSSKLPVPTSNLSDYDVAIKMLKATSDESVSLSQFQYNCYVEDEWSWKQQWLGTMSNYR